MKACLVLSLLAVALCIPPAFADDAARAREEADLRAQIDRTDDEAQKLASELHALERDHPSDTTGKQALQDRIHKLDYDEDRIMARLRALMAQDPPELRRSTAAIEEGKVAPAKPVASPAPAASPAASSSTASDTH